ncbi:hypothetical protein MQE36_13035 [Zhouia spongiae]|uniref:Uncharacterized protein n=1 Tax=Zhouia spongiae TaxID=2202721 RepID=A0ABY3YK24_9FLAO|nr:hypothetical protein [Zhouia spongiae]UNY98006.1 hypothetical protein MQE36_13035 [Zhouia spongiae]
MALLKNVNIVSRLQHHRERTISSEQLLHEVNTILNNSHEKDRKLHQLLTQPVDTNENKFVFDLLETDHIFHIDHIKKICIDYRLRFLSTRYFKGEFPQSTLNKIKLLEDLHDIDIKGYKIVAPSKLFKLENADDPLLLAPIGNGYYYLIDKWGNDLHPLRKYLMLPFKNLGNLIILIICLSLLITSLLPMKLFTSGNNSFGFWLLFMFVFKMTGSIVIFYGFALGKNFNHAIWNSKYFNA